MTRAEFCPDRESAHLDRRIIIVEISHFIRQYGEGLCVHRCLLMHCFIFTGEPDLTAAELMKYTRVCRMIPVPVRQEDLADIARIMAGLPDPIKRQIEGLRIQSGVEENASVPGIQQEDRDIVLSADVPDVRRIAETGYSVFPVYSHGTIVEPSRRLRIKELFRRGCCIHTMDLPFRDIRIIAYRRGQDNLDRESFLCYNRSDHRLRRCL